ncbi:hypothetical protein LCGC14_2983050 [marine sediment metagenome]|uniref:Uncharacterized protein n=1 Tax=marine sediment metagenome TaxID=412755 RepID=A0A0F8ZX52_9ZZZZ
MALVNPNITATAGPAALLRNYWKDTLLDILENKLIATDLAEKQVIPANSGQVIEFHRIGSFHKQPKGCQKPWRMLDRDGQRWEGSKDRASSLTQLSMDLI